MAIAMAGIFVSERLMPLKDNDGFVHYLFRSDLLSAFVCLPFFWMGHVASRCRMLSRKIPWTVKTAAVILSVSAWYVFARPGLHLHVPTAGDYLFMYLSSVSGCMAVMLLAKNLPAIPVIDYFGRYSMIILGTHAIIIEMVRSCGINHPLAIAAIVFAVMPPVIMFLRRHMSWTIGEKR